MKTHFIKLFNYNRFANDLIWQAVTDAHVPQKTLQLFSHLLTAEQAWFDRCHGLPNRFTNAWFEYTAQQSAQLIAESNDNWLDYLNKLSDADFDQIINYQNFSGHHLQDSLTDILTHVINHGTHTRAQIGQQLKLAGSESLPITDYSYYLRLLKHNI